MTDETTHATSTPTVATPALETETVPEVTTPAIEAEVVPETKA